MIYASEELAANLAISRNNWRGVDADLERLIEGLRIQFKHFARAARAGLVSDPLVLRTLGRAYENVAAVLSELGHEVRPAAVRDGVGKASETTVFVADLLECTGCNQYDSAGVN